MLRRRTLDVGDCYMLTLWTHACGLVDDHKLLPHLESGGRLQQPRGTPEAAYEIMLACWNNYPDVRPVRM